MASLTVTWPNAPITMPMDAMISSRFDCVAAKYRNGASMNDSGSITVFSEWRSISLPMVYCVIAPNT